MQQLRGLEENNLHEVRVEEVAIETQRWEYPGVLLSTSGLQFASSFAVSSLAILCQDTGKYPKIFA